MSALTLPDLTRILAACAGEDEATDLAGDILDIPFADLGYDSLALLETAARVEQDFGIKLTDEAVATLETPRGFLTAADDALRQAA